jgi:hypothetical protein
VKDHVMEIMHDDGIYRHVVFKRPNTGCMSYSLTTTPGRLIYAGDMGCFVFERTRDMFSFFRADKHEREPNFGYWHEKLVAIDRHGSQDHNVDAFRANLEEYETDDLTDAQKEEVKEFIETVVCTFEEEGPPVAYKEVYDFSLTEDLPHPLTEVDRILRQTTRKSRRPFFQDFFERSDEIYTLHYEWACHAIQYGIRVYDEFQAMLAAKSRQSAAVGASLFDSTEVSGGCCVD